MLLVCFGVRKHVVRFGKRVCGVGKTPYAEGAWPGTDRQKIGVFILFIKTEHVFSLHIVYPATQTNIRLAKLTNLFAHAACITVLASIAQHRVGPGDAAVRRATLHTPNYFPSALSTTTRGGGAILDAPGPSRGHAV